MCTLKESSTHQRFISLSCFDAGIRINECIHPGDSQKALKQNRTMIHWQEFIFSRWKNPSAICNGKEPTKWNYGKKKQFRLTGWVTALAVWQQIQPADRSDDEKIVHLYLPGVKYFIMKTFAVGQKMTHQITVDNFLIKKKKNLYISEQVNASSASFFIVLMYCLHHYYGLCYTK